MKGIELLALGLRLVGIYGVLKGIQFVGIAIGTIRQYSAILPDQDMWLWSVVYGLLILVYFLVVLWLIVFPTKIARKLMPRGDDHEPLVQIGAVELQVITFTILGVYVLSWAIPNLVHDAAVLWNITRMDDFYGPTVFSEHVIRTGVSVLEVAIGLYLTLQAAGLTRVLRMIRGLGYRGVEN